MGIEHQNVDVGAEADQFRDSINAYDSIITSDEHDGETNTTIVEYICAEGDAPFCKYRLTLEPIAMVSSEAYAELKAKTMADKVTAEAQAAE